jgi:hypothetical protein
VAETGMEEARRLLKNIQLQHRLAPRTMRPDQRRKSRRIYSAAEGWAIEQFVASLFLVFAALGLPLAAVGLPCAPRAASEPATHAGLPQPISRTKGL